MDENNQQILIIDDEKNFRDSLAEFLALDGYVSSVAENGEEGLSYLENIVFDAVVLDLRMPGMDGLEVLRKIREAGPGLPVIMMSAHGEITDAVEAMKLGATDYLVKPFDPAELVIRLGKAISDSRLIQLAHLGQRLSENHIMESGKMNTAIWLGDDPAMKDVLNLIQRVAPTKSTVLVTGESGTGKEVVAREIHNMSQRATGPFVPINVGAIPENLLESELFGYEKGSFTGADSRKSGLFELASGGTLFLDELGEMPLIMQVKLLRVLQERSIMRVGGTRAIPIDVRIIAATNRDLENDVREGKFREDLYFRINVIRLHLPPLRDRPLDVPPLAGIFLTRFAHEIGKSITGISPDALRLLSEYTFPGNIRELENMIERAVILCDSDILDSRDFMIDQYRSISVSSADSAYQTQVVTPASVSFPEKDDHTEAPLSMKDFEKRAIIAALERNDWHRERTSTELGISRRTLLTKIKEYDLHRSD